MPTGVAEKQRDGRQQNAVSRRYGSVVRMPALPAGTVNKAITLEQNL